MDDTGELSWVELPDHVTEPYDVYVNGILQEAGIDYEQAGRSLLFLRRLSPERKLGFWRWLSIFLGIAGSYGKQDTIDVVYESGGQRRVATGLPPTPAATDPS